MDDFGKQSVEYIQDKANDVNMPAVLVARDLSPENGVYNVAIFAVTPD